MKYPDSLQLKIANLLQSTGRKECVKKADLLTNSENPLRLLNLRRLNLMPSEAQELASIFKEVSSDEGFLTDSISFSYNNMLTDEGAIALIKSLPVSVRELGLVNCGMEDAGGQALLQWIKEAPHLKMVCAELNSFSDKLKSDFRKFSIENPQIMVVE